TAASADLLRRRGACTLRSHPAGIHRELGPGTASSACFLWHCSEGRRSSAEDGYRAAICLAECEAATAPRYVQGGSHPSLWQPMRNIRVARTSVARCGSYHL